MRVGELEWLWKKIEPLVEVSEGFENDGLVMNHGHNWSVLKLLILAQWIWIYTSVIPNYVDQCYYMDLLAGSGAMKLKETNDVIIGSPLIAYFFARRDFDKMLLVEMDQEKYLALRTRLKQVVPSSKFKLKFKIVNTDCNKAISSIVGDIEKIITSEKKKVHCLTFIDNEGLDTTWGTVEELLKIYTDLIILFPTVGIRRILFRAKDSQESQTYFNSLTKFFGDESWKEFKNEKELLELYKSKLADKFKEKRGKDAYVSEIRVGDRQFYYDLILVCKKGPYVDAWEYIKRRLDWANPRTVNIALNTLKRRDQVALEIFAGLNDKINEIKDQESRKEKKLTSTLEDFI